VRSFIAAVRFLTRLPMPGAATTAVDLPWAIAWFPLIGALINAAIAGIAVGLLTWWPAPIAVLLAVVAGLLLTGGFHEDAASDAADGLGGGVDNERVLAIMRDSRIGAYGAMTLWGMLTFRFLGLLLLIDINPMMAVVIFSFAGAWGRWSAGPWLRFLPPLSDGLSKDINREPQHGPWICATMFVVGMSMGCWYLPYPQLWVSIMMPLIVTVVWGCYLWRRLGGQSGDLLGAGNVLVEASVLLVALAR